MVRGLLTPENKKKYLEPELEKQALLARGTAKAMELGVGIGNLFRAMHPKSPMTFRKAFPSARRYARYSEPRLREWTGEEIGSRAGRVVDSSMQGLDRLVHIFTRGQSGISPGAREKVMRAVVKDPISVAGVPLSFHPYTAAIPGSFAPITGAVGISSRLAKKALGIPVTDAAAMRALDKHYRSRGYAHTRDFLEESTASVKAAPYYQGKPDVADTQKATQRAGAIPGLPFL